MHGIAVKVSRGSLETLVTVFFRVEFFSGNSFVAPRLNVAGTGEEEIVVVFRVEVAGSEEVPHMICNSPTDSSAFSLITVAGSVFLVGGVAAEDAASAAANSDSDYELRYSGSSLNSRKISRVIAVIFQLLQK